MPENPGVSKPLRVTRASDLRGIPMAFRPMPLSAEEMADFYAEAMNRRRGSHLQRRMLDDLTGAADQALFFKGVLYGNRGCGKSTEINYLMASALVQSRFLVIRLDALDQLNPQTFGVADVLLLLAISVIESCQQECTRRNVAFHEAGRMMQDLQEQIAPFFPDLQEKVQSVQTTGGGGEVNLLQFLKLQIRVEGQRKTDLVNQRKSLADLTALLGRLIRIANERLPGVELLVIGENFDKEQIPQELLRSTFVEYSSLLRDLPLHLLFTLPVPFVYSFGSDLLAFPRAQRYALYDVPVVDADHQEDPEGCAALTEVVRKRVDEPGGLFQKEALRLLLRASGGDLYLLFALINRAAQLARYRHEDDPHTTDRILREDVVTVVREQLGVFRNEMGTAPSDTDPTSWEIKRQKLREIYEDKPSAKVPDPTLYQLLRRRAVLFCNGKGRYGVHPLAVEMLREQFAGDPGFAYRGGGLDL